MKKTIIKIFYTIAVFVLSLFIIGHFSNKETVDMTAQMGAPTFPTISFLESGKEINLLHGYSSELEVNHVRGTVLPIDAGRNIAFNMNTYGTFISGLRFEVRQVSGDGLVENSDITNITQKDDIITGSFQLKDLIDANQEYMLVMLCNVNDEPVRYYTRIIWSETGEKYNVSDEIKFVTDFHNMTFDKQGSTEELSKYLESNSDGDNTTFSHVTIHSSYDQVTWGDLNITSHTEPLIEVSDIHSQTAVLRLYYQLIQKTKAGEDKLYNVTENFRVRYTTDRIYLLGYDRKMNYVFNGDKSDFSDNVINLWISDSNLPFKESDGGNAVAFVSEDRLYVYNSTDNKMALAFGFYNDEYNDERTRWQANRIHILNVDETGNVQFAVSGYMNRGDHEGKVGIAVYGYDSQLNTIEEQVFIPVNFHQDILQAYNDKMLYAGTSGNLFFMLEGNVYMVNLSTREQKKLIENISDDRYCISQSGSSIAWQDEDRKTVNIMDLSTQAQSEIEAEAGDFIRVLGFMGEDLTYGLVHESDVHSDQMGSLIYGMYKICIVDSEGSILENYNPGEALVTNVSIEDNVIRINRANWNPETELFESVMDDQIMSTIKTEKGSNYLTVAATEDYKNLLEIMLKSNMNVKTLRSVTPNMTLYEGSREVIAASDRNMDASPYYYVYNMDGAMSICDNPSDAINDAYNNPGVVVDDYGKYVWYRGNLLKANQIMYITNLAEEWENMPGDNSTAVCLDLILQHKGISVNVQSMLDQGKTTLDILGDNLVSARILDLDGCPMEAMLYYVNQDIPVMATMNDGSSMMIIGFNDLNTVLLEPTKGEVYKLGRNDTATLFQNNGNHFVTYMQVQNN
ncbi:hypothetical protein [Butyrivibrio sp. AE3006]|uniref:hypothetical protein n=1 Tax=Butyrivibrio sp. AE3006 TaxID=1280673 RepID=UPI00041C9064|nr:hypothetical protein [Butyrivibrio sp. AE3006]